LRDLMLYLSFKFVRKFKFCLSPLVKRYPDHYKVCTKPPSFTFNIIRSKPTFKEQHRY